MTASWDDAMRAAALGGAPVNVFPGAEGKSKDVNRWMYTIQSGCRVVRRSAGVYRAGDSLDDGRALVEYALQVTLTQEGQKGDAFGVYSATEPLDVVPDPDPTPVKGQAKCGGPAVKASRK